MANAAALPLAAVICANQFVELLLVARRDRDAGSLARQMERAGVTDALRGSGDERDSTFEVHGDLRKRELYEEAGLSLVLGRCG